MAEKGVRWAFPGLHFFKDDPVDRQLFFGREIEIKDLSETILAENFTVLFGKSGGDKGMRKLLSRFYRDITGKFKLLRLGSGPRKLKGLFGLLRRLQPLHSPRLAVRHLCEDRLITAGGNRNSRHEDEIVREVGVSKGDLDELVENRLLRREPRLQESFYELSHDSLVPSLHRFLR